MFYKSFIGTLALASLAACGSAPKTLVRSGAQSPAEEAIQTGDSKESMKLPTDPTGSNKPTKEDPTSNDPSLPGDTEDCAEVVDQCPVAGGVTWQCKKRFLHGVNYAWHNFGGDFGGIPAYSQDGVAKTSSSVNKELADMKTHGASVIRWWVFPDFRGAGVTFSADNTPTGLGATFKNDLLKALELADKNDVYLMLTMFSFDGFKPTKTVDGANIRSLSPIATDATKRKALMENVIRPMVKIAESSPYKKRLMTWELINEPEWAMTGKSKYDDPDYECSKSEMECVTHAQMETFLADLAKIVREESKALVSVGGAAIKWKAAWTKLDLDYYQFHMYDWVNTYYPYTKSPKDWSLTDKPIVMGEFPFDGVTGADANKLLSSWFTNGYGGAMGWAVTDGAFNWSGNRATVKGFADLHACETHY